MFLLSFVIILQSCYKRTYASHKTSASHRMLLYFESSCKVYGPQTKILKGRTKVSDRFFKELFNGQSPKWSTHVCEKCFENTVRNVQSVSWHTQHQGNMQLKHSATCDSRARWKQAITYDFHAHGCRMLYYVLVARCPDSIKPHYSCIATHRHVISCVLR